MNHQISNIHINKIIPQKGLIAFASFTVDEKFHFTSVGIHQKRDGSGLRLTYPTRKIGERSMYVFKPLQPELSHAIEEALFAHFENCNLLPNDRYSSA